MKNNGQTNTIIAIVLLCGLAVQANITIETVPVGDAGNKANPTGGFGTVDYEYEIGKYEVTKRQYTAFLNSVASTDTYELYDPRMWSSKWDCGITRTGSAGNYSYSVYGCGDCPVGYVNWGNAARFANWMYNGQGNGDTETGAYTLGWNKGDEGSTPPARNAGILGWALPTDDEWCKAAFYKGGGLDAGYWKYPTRSDHIPGFIPDGDYIIDPDPGNYATYNGDGGTAGVGGPCYTTDVGAHEHSDSSYGTFDQAGNIAEWVEKAGGYDTAGVWGGSFMSDDERELRSPEAFPPTLKAAQFGFRLARVPEPATLTLLALGGVVILRRR